MSKSVYKYPPIEEAICEFRFAPSQEWDLTVPGRFAELAKEYDGKPRQQKVIETELPVNEADLSPRIREKIGRTQIPTADESRIVAVGVDAVSVHVKRPYESWAEGFRNRVERALNAYESITKPEGIIRVGLRYLNVFRFAIPSVDLEEFFTFPPPPPPGLPKDFKSFLHSYDFVYDDSPARLRMVMRGIESQEKILVLDFDAYQEWEAESPLALSDAMGVADLLKVLERQAFEGMITSETRRRLDLDENADGFLVREGTPVGESTH